MRAAVRRALGRPELGVAARRVASWISTHPAGPRAVAEIERWATRAA
jgi:hypothetical protein